MSCYKQHDELHKVIDSLMQRSSDENILINSLAVAIKEATCKYLLPRSLSKGVFSLLFVGCKDYVEGSVDYYQLYERLVDVEVFAPGEMCSLEVTLSGPELTSRAPFCHPSGRLTVMRLCGRVQRLFPKNTTSSTQSPASGSYVDENFSSTADKVSASHYGSFNAWNGAPALAPSHTLAAKYSCAVMRNPGLGGDTTPAASNRGTTHIEAPLADQWKPAVQVLLDSGLLVVVLNICEQQRTAGLALPLVGTPQRQQQQQLFPSTVSPPSSTSRKSGAVDPSGYSVCQDEQALGERYRARIVLPYTPLPRPCHDSAGGESNSRGRSYPESCMYLAFQGRRSDTDSQHIAFFLYMAEHNPALRQICLQMASEIGTGRLQFPAELAQIQLEQEAIARNLVINPLRSRLLEHELQEQMRVRDKQGSPAGSQHSNVSNTSSSSPQRDGNGGIPALRLSPSAPSERCRAVRFADQAEEQPALQASTAPVQIPSSPAAAAVVPTCGALTMTFKRF